MAEEVLGPIIITAIVQLNWHSANLSYKYIYTYKQILLSNLIRENSLHSEKYQMQRCMTVQDADGWVFSPQQDIEGQHEHRDSVVA